MNAVIHKTGYIFQSDHFFDLLKALTTPTITTSDDSTRERNKFTRVVGPACRARKKAHEAWWQEFSLFAKRLSLGRQDGRLEGWQEGIKKGIKFALELKFGKKGQELLPIIAKLKSARDLTTFKSRLKKAETPAELKRFYQ